LIRNMMICRIPALKHCLQYSWLRHWRISPIAILFFTFGVSFVSPGILPLVVCCSRYIVVLNLFIIFVSCNGCSNVCLSPK
jgi:hypothetical protein